MSKKASTEATAATKEAAAATTQSTAKSTTEERPTLPCALEDFFLLTTLAWENCLDELEKFADESDRYTEAFVNDQLTLISNTQQLPNNETRVSEFTAARLQLLADYQVVNSNYKRLRKAIAYAFKEQVLIDVEWKNAGVAAYSAANNEDWNAVAKFLTAANNYLASKGKFLVDQKAIKSTFAASFKAAADTFTASRMVYIDKETGARDGTTIQNKALKAILSEYSPMIADGKGIFEFDEPNRKKFTETYLLDLVRGNHPAGLQGYLRREKGKIKTGIEGVKVFTQDNPTEFVLSDGMGYYELKKPAGVYNFVFESDKTLPYVLNKRKVKVGVMGRFNPELSPLPPAAPEAPAAVLPAAENRLLQTFEEAVKKIKAPGNGELVS